MIPYFWHVAILSSCGICFQVQAGWFYDSTCNNCIDDVQLLMEEAFQFAEVALEAIGDGPAPNSPPGTLWSFPDTEIQELTERIFGDLNVVFGTTVVLLIAEYVTTISNNKTNSGTFISSLPTSLTGSETFIRTGISSSVSTTTSKQTTKANSSSNATTVLHTSSLLPTTTEPVNLPSNTIFESSTTGLGGIPIPIPTTKPGLPNSTLCVDFAHFFDSCPQTVGFSLEGLIDLPDLDIPEVTDAKGLFGVVAKVASQADKMVIDAATCHATFPVVKGKLSNWVNFRVPPPPSPPDLTGPNPTEPNQTEPRSTDSISSSDSSSGSCSATAVPSCDITNYVSGTITQRVTSICTTISTCSGAGVTIETAVMESCVPTAIPSPSSVFHDRYVRCYNIEFGVATTEFDAGTTAAHTTESVTKPISTTVAPQVSTTAAPPSPPSPARPRDPVCLGRDWHAPKNYAVDDTMPISAVALQWCAGFGGHEVSRIGDGVVATRYMISGRGASGRQAYWLWARAGPFEQCNGGGKVIYEDCINVLNHGLEFCDKDSPLTTGFTGQGDGCVEYTVEIGDNVNDRVPSWSPDQVVHFSPPETVDLQTWVPEIVYNGVYGGSWKDDGTSHIYCDAQDGYGFTDEDVENVIGNVCIDGANLVPDGYATGLFQVHTVNVATAYKDSRWCKFYLFYAQKRRSMQTMYACKRSRKY
ncbi:hypothetical protein K505DRAFT_388144 [Melanomma pulvis-pyrius CBS 109.77]|uniref:Uncharacterized protein n=1 Tax=Melanomma pulvis-pyrius CBS 109.77 TaxID=1314802 RepID=A0A6A6X6W8_9PLEO|nr:hypothetical protein K505DRAFT_388144 [Melanomma pulvis-pyrius CBS 109.77]